MPDDDLIVSAEVTIPQRELTITAVRAQGAGGQHVNKTSTAIHLRFDLMASPSLPDQVKERLLDMHDSRITADGIIVIKSQRHRSQERNRGEALGKLRNLLASALVEERPRRPTRPSRKSVAKRLDEKARRGRLKQSRSRPTED